MSILGNFFCEKDGLKEKKHADSKHRWATDDTLRDYDQSIFFTTFSLLRPLPPKFFNEEAKSKTGSTVQHRTALTEKSFCKPTMRRKATFSETAFSESPSD